MHVSINFCSTSFLYNLKYQRHNEILRKKLRFGGRLVKTSCLLSLLYTEIQEQFGGKFKRKVEMVL
jgi:hypothetical protein